MSKKIKLKPVFLAPVIANGKLPEFGKVAAISFRNGGDSTVNLAGGRWTLDSKETLSINVTEDDDAALEVQDISVTFAGGSTNLLQILVLMDANC